MRHPSPGDKPIRYQLQSEQQVHNRVHIGQIVAVDTATGTCKVAVHGTPQEFTAVIPTQAISLNQANGFKSSWQRYMPSRYSYVKIGYGLDNRPQLLGMATWGHAGATNGPYIAGYAQAQERANRGADGLSDFVQLREGEWDMRSSGNAYLHGSDKGRLLLAGGAVRAELRKEEDEFDLRSGLTRISNGAGSTIRLGTIKRALGPSALTETEITGSTNEYSVRVETGTALSVPMYEARIGDVRNFFGVPELGLAPLRARYSYYDPTGALTAFEATVDQLGNITGTHGSAAVSGLSLSGLTSQLNTDYLGTTINSLIATNVTADVRVALGTELAIEPVVKGLTWTTARATQHTIQIGLHTTMATAWGAIASALSARLANQPPPISDPDLLALYTLLNTLATAATTAETTHQTALTTFEAGSVGYLSLKVFTE